MDNTEDLLRRLRAAAAEAKEKSFSMEMLLRAAIRQIVDMQRIHQLDRMEIVQLRQQVEANYRICPVRAEMFCTPELLEDPGLSEVAYKELRYKIAKALPIQFEKFSINPLPGPLDQEKGIRLQATVYVQIQEEKGERT